MNRDVYRVEGSDGEATGYVRAAGSRWAFGRSRTGKVLGTAPDLRLAAVALRDLAEASR